MTAGNFQLAAERTGSHPDGGRLVYAVLSPAYWDVEELMVERGLDTDHVTVWRWVQRPRLGLHSNASPPAKISLFLALLELAKQGQLRLEQRCPFGLIAVLPT